MNKFLIGVVAALSLSVSACGDPTPNVGQIAAQCDPQDVQCMGQVAQQQGGGFVQDHPYLTAGAAAAGAYYLGKRSERRNGYNYNRGYNGGGYYAPRPRTRVVTRTVYRRAPSVFSSGSSFSRPSGYRTVTRTTTYRRR